MIKIVNQIFPAIINKFNHWRRGFCPYDYKKPTSSFVQSTSENSALKISLRSVLKTQGQFSRNMIKLGSLTINL